MERQAGVKSHRLWTIVIIFLYLKSKNNPLKSFNQESDLVKSALKSITCLRCGGGLKWAKVTEIVDHSVFQEKRGGLLIKVCLDKM